MGWKKPAMRSAEEWAGDPRMMCRQDWLNRIKFIKAIQQDALNSRVDP